MTRMWAVKCRRNRGCLPDPAICVARCQTVVSLWSASWLLFSCRVFVACGGDGFRPGRMAHRRGPDYQEELFRFPRLAMRTTEHAMLVVSTVATVTRIPARNHGASYVSRML